MSKLIALLILISGLLIAGKSFLFGGEWSKACREISSDIAICAASDMAKVPNNGIVKLEHSQFSIAEGPLTIQAARNETVAFQLIIQNRNHTGSESLSLSVQALRDADGNRLPEKSVQLFQAWYHYVDKGGYTWGPDSTVLPWPEYYPDALIPQYASCGDSTDPFYEAFTVPATDAGLQSVWVDIYVPREQAAGIYKTAITAKLDSGEDVKIPVELTVWAATLPDKPSFDAVGEVYLGYVQEGVGMDIQSDAWREMSHCYQTLAHQHRMTFIERSPVLQDGSDWTAYDAAYDPVLTGTLFSEQNGYFGTGVDTPVSVWRTPWPQEYDVELAAPLTDAKLEEYSILAKNWWNHVSEKNWLETEYFAYVFDEIDGPLETEDESGERQRYLAMAHAEMDRVQTALDAGAGDNNIDLLWTSHSDPSIWAGDEALDLSGKVRWWAPNAAAANPQFFAERKKNKEKIWFYHDGHPSVGVHSINASGIELRTWGVIGARYQFDGQFMWSVNLGSDEQPFARPSYKDDDDRFGNGVMVYPGNQLDKIGYRSEPGPIPSMRLKSWRRGLQDAELVLLAEKAGKGDQVRKLLEFMIPEALGDADGDAKWPTDSAVWIDFHQDLLKLASGHDIEVMTETTQGR